MKTHVVLQFTLKEATLVAEALEGQAVILGERTKLLMRLGRANPLYHAHRNALSEFAVLANRLRYAIRGAAERQPMKRSYRDAGS